MRSGFGGTVRAGRQPRVIEREAARDHPELAESVELPGGLRRHPGERVEVVDLGRDLRAERRRVEAVDALDRGAARAQARPERVDAGADRGDEADPRDPDCGVDRSCRWIRRRRGSDWTASASALNVARVRPAMGRVKKRSTKAAKPGNARPEVVLDDDVRAVAGRGSIRHVTSIPRVAPATWTKRSRRDGRSVHVRDRQATGRPRPRTPMSGRRATKSATRLPSGRRSTAAERA